MIAQARRHRFVIGLIAGYALLLSAILPAFASVVDPLQAYLGSHLCGPSEAQNGKAPATPTEHQQKCQLCGPSCAMGGHAPVATLADSVAFVTPRSLGADTAHRFDIAALAPLSLYPSDIFAQGPPQAA